MKRQIKREVFALTAVLSAATLLTGCSLTGEAGKSGSPDEGAPVASTETEAAPQLDPGPYTAEPNKGWDEVDGDLGIAAEMAEVANHTLLPFEVDNDLTVGGGDRRVWTLDQLNMDFPKPAQERLAPLAPKFLLGYGYFGSDSNEKRNAGNLVLRFEDPESAQQAADAIVETNLTEGHLAFFEDDPHEPGTEEKLEGHPDATAVRSMNGEGIDVVKVHNEYLMYTTAYNADEASDPDSVKWQQEYASDFFTKQAPLLDIVKTHKTEAGYGFSDEWPEVDPNDILKYTVLMPKDESFEALGGLPMQVNSRGMSGTYREVKEIHSMIDQAQVEAMAKSETSLFRTKHPEGAELIMATMRSVDVDSNFSEWDPPQDIPGMECYQYDPGFGTTYTCYLVYENYFAQGSAFEGRTQENKIEGEDGKPVMDPKEQLGQAMAAQYLILQQATSSSGEPASEDSATESASSEANS